MKHIEKVLLCALAFVGLACYAAAAEELDLFSSSTATAVDGESAVDDAPTALPSLLYGGSDDEFAEMAQKLRDFRKPQDGKRSPSWAAANKFAKKLVKQYVLKTAGMQSGFIAPQAYGDFDAYLIDSLGKQGRGLTAAEYALYQSNRFKALLCIANGKLAYDYGFSNYLGTAAVQEDGNGDAFRHALWNFGMAIDVGQTFAKQWGDAHEAIPGNPALRKSMDLFNNAVGLQLARDNPWTIFHSTFISLTKAKCRAGALRIIVNNALVRSSSVGEK
eukprot:gene1420-1762_t